MLKKNIGVSEFLFIKDFTLFYIDGMLSPLLRSLVLGPENFMTSAVQ